MNEPISINAEKLLRSIVAGTAEQSNTDLQKNQYPVEPALLAAPRNLSPCFDSAEHYQAHLDHIERRILRNPRDLFCHTQRLLMYKHLENDPACFGALIDLMIALGNQGISLRKSLLMQTLERLTQQQVNFLRTHLKSGLRAEDPIPPDAQSLLSKHISGTTSIVRTKSTECCGDADLLESALGAIESGNDLTAQKYLEQALDNDPGDKEVCDELLALYLRNQLNDDLLATMTRLSARKIALPELWKMAALCLNTEVTT